MNRSKIALQVKKICCLQDKITEQKGYLGQMEQPEGKTACGFGGSNVTLTVNDLERIGKLIEIA